MDVNENGFRYLKNRFCLEKSYANLYAGAFTRPEIPRLIKNLDFKYHLNHLKLPAWESFMQIVENIVGYYREI